MLCWGDNQYGQLGDGTTTDRLVPTTVSDTLAFLGVSAGAGHTCAITVKGEAYCWGRNSYGQLGDNTTTDHLIPVKVVKP
jgi:alpha-tubulin suppressor-like RCC1 family protein